MTEMRPLVEGYIDLNIALLLGLALWFVFKLGVSRTRYAQAFSLQRGLLGALLLAILASPFVAPMVTGLVAQIWPKHSLALTDVAVAAYLDGRIAMKAVAFEDLLNTRQRWLDRALAGDTVGFQLLLGALAIGFAAMLGRLVSAALAVRRTVKASHRWRSTRRVDVRISDTTALPFAVRGLRRRTVVLPASLVMRPKDLRLVLAHEFLHIRKGDTELELLIELLRPFFFWNPAFRVWKAQLEQVRELSCDQVIARRGNWQVQDYAQCLIDLCAQSLARSKGDRFQVGFIQAGRAKRDLHRRIAALCSGPVPVLPLWSSIGVALALGLVFTVTFAAVAVRPAQDWSQDRLMLSTVVNLERLQQINRGF